MSIVNLLAQIKQNLKKKKVVLLQRKTKVIIEVLNALWDEKIIYGYYFFNKDFIKIYLKFNKSGKSLIRKLNLISTSGRRIYMSVSKIKKLVKTKSFFFLVVSTPKGIVSHNKAISNNLGGEILFSISL